MNLNSILDLALNIATLLGIIFAIYLYFRKPQEKGEVNDAIFNLDLRNLEKTVINLRDNHLHTVEQKLDKHILDNQTYTEGDIKWKTKVETLLEERLPRK